MCGICGLIDLAAQRGSELTGMVLKMTDRLAHRGPDDQGLWHEQGIALGHRRLSVIDLEGSRQPMRDTTGRYVIVFNGEIYNYIELRRELEQCGIRFRTNGDTEVLLASYIIYGADCLDRLNGMYAFAIWDSQKKTLFAARDRLGVKPFFYGLGQKGVFVFSSELQAVRGLPVDFALNHRALVQYLHHGFIRSPDTIFRGIRELRPGHFLRYGRKGLEIRPYWQPPLPDPTLNRKPVLELAQELRELLRSAVFLRLRSDVPLGAFLSGGLDSSAIVATMRDLGETDIHTFAIGFDETSFDEGPYAKDVAEHFHTIHHESRARLDAEDLLLNLVRHYGQPYGDSSAIPTWHLCEKTRRQVTVAFSGDGGDEIFCGYRRYVARRLLDCYRHIPGVFRRRLFPILATRLPEGTHYYDHSLTKKLRLFVSLDQRVDSDPDDIYPAYFTLEGAKRLLDGFIATEKIPDDESIHLINRERLENIELMMRADLLHYLPDDILTKVDRASMAHSLEVRSPFMDYRIVEFACRLPLRFKLRGLTTKYLLRKAFARDLPPEPLKRKKHGFAVPLGDWFQGSLREMFHDLVGSGQGTSILRHSEAERLINEHQTGHTDHGHRLWLILFLHAWHQWWHGR